MPYVENFFAELKLYGLSELDEMIKLLKNFDLRVLKPLESDHVDLAQATRGALNRLVSRNGQPSAVTTHGHRLWHDGSGQLHRDDGLPAIEWSDGSRAYYQHGRLVRLDYENYPYLGGSIHCLRPEGTEKAPSSDVIVVGQKNRVAGSKVGIREFHPERQYRSDRLRANLQEGAVTNVYYLDGSTEYFEDAFFALHWECCGGHSTNGTYDDHQFGLLEEGKKVNAFNDLLGKAAPCPYFPDWVCPRLKAEVDFRHLPSHVQAHLRASSFAKRAGVGLPPLARSADLKLETAALESRSSIFGFMKPEFLRELSLREDVNVHVFGNWLAGHADPAWWERTKAWAGNVERVIYALVEEFIREGKEGKE